MVAVLGSSCSDDSVSIKSEAVQGEPGKPGPVGEEKGESGDRGDKGARGDKGVKGPKGARGASGRNGRRGPPGRRGPGYGVHERITGSTIGGTSGGTYSTPGGNPWFTQVNFEGRLPTPLTSDQILIRGIPIDDICYKVTSDPFGGFIIDFVEHCLSDVQRAKPNQRNVDLLCPNSDPENPAAAPGYLCIYITSQDSNVYRVLGEPAPAPESTTGFVLKWSSGSGPNTLNFVWAYTGAEGENAP